MTMLVTLDQARAQVKMDHDLDDDQLTFLIHAASALVLNYMKDNALQFVDTSGVAIAAIPYEIQAATVVLVGMLYGNAGEDGGTGSGWSNYLPPYVCGMLYKWRVPTVQ